MRIKLLFAPVFAAVVVSLSAAADTGYIDVHTHLAGRERSVAAASLVEKMDEYGVSKAIVMPPPQAMGQAGAGDYKLIAQSIKEYPGRLVLGGGGNLLNKLIEGHDYREVTPEIKEEFRKRAEELVRAGVKVFGEMTALHLSMNEKHVFEEMEPDHPLFLLLADISAERGIPIDLHMEAVPEKMPTPKNLLAVSSRNPSELHPNIERFERLLSHNRKARIVWQHVGWDNVGALTVELLRRLLGAHENLYLALRVEERVVRIGTRAPMPNRIVDGDWHVKPEWLKLMSDFPSRFVIGTDEFFGKPGFGHNPQSFEETWSILDELPPDIREKVGRENAALVYNL